MYSQEEYNRRFDCAEETGKLMSDADLIARIREIREDDDRQNERGFLGRIRCGDPEFSALMAEARRRKLSPA